MKSNKSTTYILLERGVEDMQLYDELLKIQSKMGYKSDKDFTKEFPKFTELRQGLRDEIGYAI